MDENKFFLHKIEEKYEKFLRYEILMWGDFLTMEEQSQWKSVLKKKGGGRAFLWGGFPEAERQKVIFMPEYTQVDHVDALGDYFFQNPQDCPIQVLDCKIPKRDRGKLSHRDYLGALMGLGIKREKIGDIIVREDGAYLLVAKEIAEYLKGELSTVGRVPIDIEVVSIEEMKIEESKKERKKLNVASPRLDNVVAVIFGISRKAAVASINKGLVFVGGTELLKVDFTLKGGEKIVLRGKGKAIYLGQVGTSKKGKAYIEVEKYL